jgi:hypothetical protein
MYFENPQKQLTPADRPASLVTGGLQYTALATIVLFILGGEFLAMTQQAIPLQPIADAVQGVTAGK